MAIDNINKVKTPQHIKDLYDIYVKEEFSGLILPDEVMKRIRKGYVMGFHTAYVFIRKILAAEDHVALRLMSELEPEMVALIKELQKNDDFKKIANIVWRN